VNVAAKPPRRHSLGNIPEENRAVAAARYELFIVCGDIQTKHFVSMRRIRLDEATLWDM
jgi:hypothetical protein